MAKNELITDSEFSYDELDKETAGILRNYENEINRHKKNAAFSMMGIGETLFNAQEKLANQRTFGKWIEKCGFSRSTAYRYIDAYRAFSGCPNLGQMEDSAMYALSQKDTPPKAVKEVLKLTGQGMTITHKQAKEIIKKYKPTSSPSAPSGSSAPAPSPPAKPEPTKDEQLKLEIKKARSYAEYLQRSIDDLNGLKRNTVMHPQLIKACAQILEGLKRW